MRKTKKDYPLDWDELSLLIKQRAGWRCEWCSVQFTPGDNVREIFQGGKFKKITYTVHHKDRNTKNNKPENLVALCSPCHCRAELPLIRRELREKKEKDQITLEF